MPKRPEVPFDPQWPVVVDEDGNEHNEVVNLNRFGDRYDEVVDAIEALPPKERRIIEALFWERLSLTRIGQEMGMTKQSVHYHYKKAIARLMEVLNEDGD